MYKIPLSYRRVAKMTNRELLENLQQPEPKSYLRGASVKTIVLAEISIRLEKCQKNP